jgi:glucose-6-phosphate 1-epimerase
MKYIKVENNSASAVIALQGAQILEYALKDDESLFWLSDKNEFEVGKVIRGGVPICWPWFGMHKHATLPQHGFARIFIFEHIETKELDKDTTEVLLRLKDSKESLELWDYKFELDVKITISKELMIELITKNTDTKPFEITQALHSYFSISNIEDIRIIGLDGCPYLDALIKKEFVQDGDILFDEEIDRIYQDVRRDIVLMDETHVVDIKNEGSSSVVVWNPWIDKCKRLSTMRDDAYKEFVCIESANALYDSKTIQPDASHTLKVIISKG